MTISRIPVRQAKKNPPPRAQTLASPASWVAVRQIPDPVKMFNVFPIPAQYFDQIPDPDNTLPDPLRYSKNYLGNYFYVKNIPVVIFYSIYNPAENAFGDDYLVLFFSTSKCWKNSICHRRS